MSNLLDRMAEALRETTTECEHNGGVDHPVVRRADAILAEYERVKARTVVLTFEKAKEIRDYNSPSPRFFILAVGCAGVVHGVSVTDGDYAYAVLPTLPGPEVFQ